MTNNHEKFINDINVENLTCSVEIYRGCTYPCRKSSKGTGFEAVSLAFSNFF